MANSKAGARLGEADRQRVQIEGEIQREEGARE